MAAKRLLVIVDPTASSHPAVERAAWLARHAQGSLELFISDYAAQLAESRSDARAAEGRAAVLARHERRLEQLAEPLRKSGLDVAIDVRWDSPLHDSIVRKAVDNGADIVLKDTHYHSALQRSVFSNTDWNLIRACAATLWLVKERAPAERPCLIAAVDPLHQRDKPADLDGRILRTAIELGNSLGGDVHAFHAFDVSTALAVSTDSMAMPVALPADAFADAMRNDHTQAVRRLCKAHGITAERVHVQQGSTRDLLMALSDQLRADAVIMGAVSRSGFKGLFLGNTAEDVLDRLHCDLIVVKPDGFKPALPA